MPSVLFKGGPFDGRSGQKPERDLIAVPAGTDGNAVRLAVYVYDGTDYVFQRAERVWTLVGGPLDGVNMPVNDDVPEGDGLVVPTPDGRYAWHKPAGEGRYRFDGYSTTDDLELIAEGKKCSPPSDEPR